MSGIVGFWNYSGEPVSSELLRTITLPTQHRARDGQFDYVQGCFGASLQAMRITPEDLNDQFPFVSRSGNVCLVDGRLFNRDELSENFRWTSAERETYSDTAFVAEAYERWQHDFAARLRGELAIAIFDQRLQRVILARDLAGIRPLYFTDVGGTFLFGSEIKNLLAHHAVSRTPDDDVLADVLVGGDARPSEHTWFAAVRRVLPGCIYQRDRKQGQAWRFAELDPFAKPRLHSFEEYAEAVRAPLERAIGCRTRSSFPVGVSVSGGFDSSAILCLAEKLRKCRGGTQVFGVSALYEQGSPADESQYLADIESTCGVEIFRVDASRHALLQNAADEIIQGEAPLLIVHAETERALAMKAAARGARVLLTGSLGDMVTYPLGYWFDLLIQGRWLTLNRHLDETCRWFQGIPKSGFRGLLWNPGAVLLTPSFLRPSARRLRSLVSRNRPAAWFSQRLLERARERRMKQSASFREEGSYHARRFAMMLNNSTYQLQLEIANKTGAALGVERSLPLFDQDLIEFVASIPGEVLNRGGEPRALFRQTLRGVLPESIRMRRSKADFGPAVGQRAMDAAQAVASIVKSDSAVVQMGYVDADKIALELDQLRPKWATGLHLLPASRLADLFALEIWLRMFVVGQTSSVTAPGF